MRVLIYPVYEYQTFVEADSSYILMKGLRDYFLEKNVYPYWFTPLPELSGDIPLKKYHSRDLYEIYQYEGLDKFNVIDGEYPLDFAITNNPGKAAELINFFAITGFGKVKIPVYLWEFANKFESAECEIRNLQKENIALHCLAFCICEKFAFPTEYGMKQTRRMVKKYLSSAMLEKFDKSAIVIPYTADFKLLEKSQSVKDPKLSFYFGGRFTATKGGEKIAKFYDYIFSLGNNIKVKFTVPVIQRRLSKYIKKRGQEFEIHTKLSQKDAWKVMSSCHISIFDQSLKFLPAAPFEQLYSGLIVMFKDYGFEKAILPPEYPYIYKNEADGFAMLKWIIENYDEAIKRIKYVKKWIETNIDRRNIMEYFYNDMCKVIDNRRKLNNEQAQRVRLAFNNENEVEWNDLIKKVQGLSRYPTLTFASSKKANMRGMMKALMYQRLIPEEYEDDCKSIYPNYIKKS